MGDIGEAYILKHFYGALESGDIRAFFQPIFRSVTEKVACAEALARWRDAEHGMLSPADFIPVLESHGLIFDLDMEMLRQTCAFYAALRERGTPLHSFSVNLSRQDFRHGELYERVIETLAEYDVPREAIKLEITESLMLEDIKVFRRLFRQFSDAGFSIWIDDFGSGYSSLNVLQNFSFDLMKFDMLFLRNFSERGRKLLASQIGMAKSLGIHTLTEGVETGEQHEFLRAAGCEAEQGFFFSRPLPGEELMAWIDRQPERLETLEDKEYWNRIGHLNFLSANPLDEFADMERPGGAGERGGASGVPLALLECGQNRARCVYANDNYLKCVRDLGYRSLEDLEARFNDHRSDQYLMLKKLVTDAIRLGTRQQVEYINNDVYYRVSAKCLARKRDRAMLAMRLTTIDSESEIRTAQEMLNYGNALFSTYELVVLIYPKKNLSNRIYSANSLPVYDRSASLSMSVEQFCRAEVDPADQPRYLRFMDFCDMGARIEASEKRFIQGFFRMRWSGAGGNWYTARVTQVPGSAEKAYLLTFQPIQAAGQRWLEQVEGEADPARRDARE